MVTNFRDSLEKICGERVDILFCNEEEALSWKGSDRIDLAIRELREIASNVFVTLGKNGSICLSSDGQYQVKTSQVEAVDTNGREIFMQVPVYQRFRPEPRRMKLLSSEISPPLN
ncbi:MAG: hypothetical protein CM1200mP24_01550 [Gammaproteobacteria bacterium]|nr:MAG: hypothetical protein CM1200mP24_01550 [Gammaproteobacteria bacterium]